MTDSPEDRLLHILREIKNDLAGLRRDVRRELKGVGARLLAIEERLDRDQPSR